MKLNKQVFIISLFAILFFSCTTEKTNNGNLPRSTPSEEGVSSQAILEFIDAVENSNHELHSLMILRHGKVVAEGWWAPYAADLKHTMYSTSKSFTSTAIGFAVSENLISVSDKVISFFPDYLPDTISENLADLEIRDLLSMTVGQEPEPSFGKVMDSENWIKEVLAAPIVHKPGTKFLYNSFGTYLLAAIIHEVSGENVIDYLKPRLFEPLNISGMDWEVDPMGINVGGWGLRIKTEDMAKLGQLYLQKGTWHGKQILSEEWVVEATSSKILQSPELSEDERNKSDWLQGYGYKFWRSRHNSYRGDGAFGQYILVLPEHDAVIAITSETHDMQAELNLVWEHLLPAFNDSGKSDETVDEQLKNKLNSLQLDPPVANISKAILKNLDGKTFLFDENDENLESVSFGNAFGNLNTTITFADNKTLDFSFGANQWTGGETNKPANNLVTQPNDQILKLAPFKIAGAYSCINDNTIELVVRYTESPHTDFYLFETKGDSIFLEMSNSINQRSRVEKYKGALQQD